MRKTSPEGTVRSEQGTGVLKYFKVFRTILEYFWCRIPGESPKIPKLNQPGRYGEERAGTFSFAGRSFAFPGRGFRDAVRTAEKFSKDAQKIKEGLKP